jgi:hypothetical protein
VICADLVGGPLVLGAVRLGLERGRDALGLRAEPLLGHDGVVRIRRLGVVGDGRRHRIASWNAPGSYASRRWPLTTEPGATGPALHDGEGDRHDEGDDENGDKDVHV